jgi:hypothetical protein
MSQQQTALDRRGCHPSPYHRGTEDTEDSDDYVSISGRLPRRHEVHEGHEELRLCNSTPVEFVNKKQILLLFFVNFVCFVTFLLRFRHRSPNCSGVLCVLCASVVFLLEKTY